MQTFRSDHPIGQCWGDCLSVVEVERLGRVVQLVMVREMVG